MRRLTLREESFAYREPFRISGHLFTKTSVLVAEIEEDGIVGRGEGAGVYYLGDDIAHMREEAETARAAIEAGIGRQELQALMHPGGARNALDCALWDLEAGLGGKPAWEIAGLRPPEPLPTTITIGADTPEAMAATAAGRLGDWPMLKLKLTGDAAIDWDRVLRVREARPDAWIGVDANQGYRREGLLELQPLLVEAEIRLLEQPLPRGAEADLDGVERSLPFAADESVCSLAELAFAEGRFDLVNIKLDKCGGLTEGLELARRCRKLGLGVMVGNMMGSSLTMGPSLLLAQLCDVVDLDGPTFLADDREPGVEYRDGKVSLGGVGWGGLLPASAAVAP